MKKLSEDTLKNVTGGTGREVFELSQELGVSRSDTAAIVSMLDEYGITVD